MVQQASSPRSAFSFVAPRILAGLALAALLADGARAVVRGDVHWRRADSPVVLDASLVVELDGSLTVDPGVEVRLPEGAVLRVQGRLLVLGRSHEPVRFLPREGAASWGGIVIDGGDVLISHASIEDADAGIEASGGASVLDSVRVLRGRQQGIRATAPARLRLVGCLVEESGGTGLELLGTIAEISDCLLRSNETGVRVGDGGSLLADGLRVDGAGSGLLIEPGGRAILMRSEIARCDDRGVAVAAGGSLHAAECALHDNGVGLRAADSASVAIGSASGAGMNVFACNALDVVNDGAAALDASGNYWGGGPAILVSGDVDSAPHLEEMPAEVARMERLMVTKGAGVAFSWESVADCSSHEVLSSADPAGGFASAPDAASEVVFYQLRTRPWGIAAR